MNRALGARLRVIHPYNEFPINQSVIVLQAVQSPQRKEKEKMGLGVRLLPPLWPLQMMLLAAATASVKFASQFGKSMKDKRAAIRACLHRPGVIKRSLKRQTGPGAEDGSQGEAVVPVARAPVPRAQGLRFRSWQAAQHASTSRQLTRFSN
jgi:hypothetical protein